MNIFICHSWQDKTTAELIAHDIKPLGKHVWLARKDNPAIDLALVIWTRQAARAESVRQACDELAAQQIPALVCLFDDTPVPAGLQVNATDMRDYRQGYIALVRSLFADSKSAQSFADDIDHILEQISVHERYFYTHVQPGLENLGLTETQQKLLDVIRTDNDRPQATLRLRQSLEQWIHGLPRASMQTDTTQTYQTGFQPAPDIFTLFSTMPEYARQKISGAVQNNAATADWPRIAEEVYYYVQTAADLLGLLNDITANTQPGATTQLAQYLHDVCNAQKQTDRQHDQSIWNICAVACLIHNTAARLIEARLIPITMLPFDWQKIVAADLYIIAMLPAGSRYRLEMQLLLFMRTIAQETRQYQPAFSYQNGDYHPLPLPAQVLGTVAK